jgi:hypothetical protein
VHVFLYADAGTVPGNTYNLDLAVLPAPCLEDSYEENDTQASASPVSAGLITGLGSCDADYYEVDLLIGETLSVSALFTDAEGDIDVQLMDASGAVLVSGTTMSDDEVLTPYVATAAGTYTVHVFLYADAGSVPGNSYDLNLVVLPAPCLDDSYEDNDSLAAASSVSGGLISGLRVCSSDDDYFSFTVTTGDTVTADLIFSDAEGDIDLRLYDDSNVLIASSLTASDNESVGSWLSLESGTWKVRANLFLDAGAYLGNSYSFDLALPGCLDDSNEPNDSSPTATTTGFFNYSTTEQTLCSGDVDWYSHYLYTGETLTAEAMFTDAEGDLDLEIYDPSGIFVTGAYTGSDDETVTHVVTTDGLYYVRAYTYWLDPDDGQVYDLDISHN